MAPMHFVTREHRCYADAEDNPPEKVQRIAEAGCVWRELVKDGGDHINAFVLTPSTIAKPEAVAVAAPSFGFGAVNASAAPAPAQVPAPAPAPLPLQHLVSERRRSLGSARQVPPWQQPRPLQFRSRSDLARVNILISMGPTRLLQCQIGQPMLLQCRTSRISDSQLP